MKNIARKIVSFLTLFFVFISVIVIIMSLFGIEPTIMLTGSMTPQIPVGSVCFVDKNYSYDKLKTNDVIAYKTPTYRVIHRIVAVTDKGYKTKGDSNQKEDIKIITKDIYYGKLLFSVPYVGYIVTNLQNKAGKVILIAIIILVVGANYFLNRKEDRIWQQ